MESDCSTVLTTAFCCSSSFFCTNSGVPGLGLEQATKDYGAQLVFSREVATRAGFDVASLRLERIEVRGRDEPLEIVVVPDSATLRVEP